MARKPGNKPGMRQQPAGIAQYLVGDEEEPQKSKKAKQNVRQFDEHVSPFDYAQFQQNQRSESMCILVGVFVIFVCLYISATKSTSVEYFDPERSGRGGRGKRGGRVGRNKNREKGRTGIFKGGASASTHKGGTRGGH